MILRRVVLSAVLGLAAAIIAVPVPGEETASDVQEILDRVDDLFRGDASRGEMSMTITTAHWQRTLSLAFWSRGEDESLMRILAPKKEKGTATLRVGTNLWNYLPKVKRVIKLPSSMMSASWMGSHFTNNDLVKQSRMADDYRFEQSFAGERDGEEVIEITCLPGAEAAVVWGKVEVRVRRGDYLPLRISYYDERMELARTMIFSEFRPLGGRLLPAKMTVVPADEPEERTVVEYHAIDFDPKLDDDVFSLHNLRR
ncbi:MAG: outer membrane lipoprotein-sorting protein [bacterium]|nr:outer membrane lipoprotein-sorting protein [bacterium]